MHEVDQTTEQMVRSVLAYAENRLRMDPVPLDKGTQSADRSVPGAGRGDPGPRAASPDEVLGVYSSVIAPSIISADSPRFLGFIPAAPTKASLLFDMLVSCASIQGISWLEASGAIAAENTVLRLIADEAGHAVDAPVAASSPAARPATCRRWRWPGRPAKQRLGEARGRPAAAGGRRHRRALLDRQHAAAAGDGRAGGRHPRSPADRGDGRGGDRGRPGRQRRRRGRLHVRDHQRRHRRRPGRCRGDRQGARLVVPRRRRLRRIRDLRPVRPDQVRGIEQADSFILDPHKWLFTPVRLLRAAVPRTRTGQGDAHPGRVLPGRHPHR